MNNTITGNTSTGDGGAVYCAGGSPTIANNAITNNQISGSGEGGGVMLEGCTNATISANMFLNNDGNDYGGAIAMHYSTGATIVNNLFVHNHVSGAGGLGGGAIHAAWGSDPLIVNNTFVENWVGTGTWPNITPAAYGGAIHVRSTPAEGPVKVINNIFYDNRALHGNSAGCTESGVAHISYCDAWPGDEATNYAYATGGQYYLITRYIYVDPGFYSPANGQYWLGGGSALRTVLDNHGQSRSDNSDIPEQDIEARPRPGADGLTDMGAYENDGRP
jgi:predicted outer membrane repeat protein